MNGKMIGKFTLDNFYKSNEWYNLMQYIKMDRLNEDGQLICEYCGKPITRSYDAIGHHTIFLTEDNVNDLAISLNEKLIQVVHHHCHNKIHNKFGYIKREVYLVYGAPLSGKTTWVQSVREPGDLVIDVDSIWECVSGLERFKKPPCLNAVVFSIRDKLLECVKYKVGKWNNAYIIGGYPLISERERMCREYGAKEIYIECTEEECLKRLKEISDGRDPLEWEKFIHQWYRRYAPRSI